MSCGLIGIFHHTIMGLNIVFNVRIYFSQFLWHSTYMQRIIILLLCFLSVLPASARRMCPERVYQEYWCGMKEGVTEYELPDKTRVDCLLPDLAVEFDFANKWAECIGQALYYGQRTGKTPACVLIMERGEKDLKYLKRLRYAVYNKKKIPEFRTFTIKPDKACTPEIQESFRKK